MHTQEVVCPTCGKSAVINVIDKAGRTESPCQHCKYKISVRTDAEGKITSLHSGARCFIATACLSASLPTEEAERELAVIRDFRDSYVALLPDGPALLEEYYSIAPHIVQAIYAGPRPHEVLRLLYTDYLSDTKSG